MKLPAVLAACILAMPFPVSGEIDDDINAAETAAEQEYVEKYSELIKSGKLDPPADRPPGKPDSIERRLWMAGYYSVVVDLLDPAKAQVARDPGLVDPYGRGVGIHYSLGLIAGRRSACEMAKQLFLEIRARHFGDLDARLAREAKEPPSPPPTKPGK